MYVIRLIGLVGGMVVLGSVAGWAGLQVRPHVPQPDAAAVCLHESLETARERERREEALAMVRLTGRVVEMARGFPGRQPADPGYPNWAQLGEAGARLGRMDGGALGRLARTVQWGSLEPLPGWRAHYVADVSGYSLTITDARDACGWTYFADDRGVIGQGYPLEALGGIVPAGRHP
jgi:hypothetical protein